MRASQGARGRTDGARSWLRDLLPTSTEPRLGSAGDIDLVVQRRAIRAAHRAKVTEPLLRSDQARAARAIRRASGGRHSNRSVTMGSVRVTRYAGTKLATKATAKSTPMPPARAAGSAGLTPKRTLRSSRASGMTSSTPPPASPNRTSRIQPERRPAWASSLVSSTKEYNRGAAIGPSLGPWEPRPRPHEARRRLSEPRRRVVPWSCPRTE